LARYDYEYSRKGVCNIFIATEPLMGKRIVKVTARRTKQDWAKFLIEVTATFTFTETLQLIFLNDDIPL